ncbi:MAG: hypothetical protein M3Q49_08415 [Actinomycetota bacterium]|nr:hypothetical protein [Actinomycetota bacterium]
MRRMVLLVTVAAALVALAGVASAAPGSTDPDASKQLAEVREATAKYQDESKARTDGYERTDHCIEDPKLGGMGYHYANMSILDLQIDPLKPELLLYAPSGDGGRKLVAVEYMVPDVGQKHPTLFGKEFNGPMPGHEPGMPVHYDLHVWAWEANPNGIFAPFNPNVRC